MLPVPRENLKVAVTSAEPAAHHGPSKTPATAFMTCWKGKTREAPTGTAKEESRTPSPAKSAARTSLRVAPAVLPTGLRKRQLLHHKVTVEAVQVDGEGGESVEQAGLEGAWTFGPFRSRLPSPAEVGQGAGHRLCAAASGGGEASDHGR